MQVKLKTFFQIFNFHAAIMAKVALDDLKTSDAQIFIFCMQNHFTPVGYQLLTVDVPMLFKVFVVLTFKHPSMIWLDM